ncbi:MAG: hypothetical protein P8Y63_01235 [Deltaproteobacteria bacterium]
MWLKWLPWRFLISRMARSRGFIDPVGVLARMHRFAQPSEVSEPIELLRAGLMFHARGLINTRAIQHNLDWLWPWWVEKQFNPFDPSYIPRPFTATHINLTHRNWTALGLPSLDRYPIVDPAGLLTPVFDGWSLDVWLVSEQGEPLLPSRARPSQELLLEPNLAVRTQTERGDCRLDVTAEVLAEDGTARCHLKATARCREQTWLALALRPCNPEGISFVHDIASLPDVPGWLVNDKHRLTFDRIPDSIHMSTYEESDVLQQLPSGRPTQAVRCEVGMATAAALFGVAPGQPTGVSCYIPLSAEEKSLQAIRRKRRENFTWQEALAGCCTLRIPDQKLRFLFDAAIRTLILHSPHEVYPGPYTYKRFWFRDASFILDALLALHLPDRVETCLRLFPGRQKRSGYFYSQNGEWDANGEAMWIIHRYASLSGRRLPPTLLHAVKKGAQWICSKRLTDDLDAPHAGLMPAGFSAEHFGPNDYYFWDNFWSAAGLFAAAELLTDEAEQARAWRQDAELLLAAVDRSLHHSAIMRIREGIPASPYRRMDSAAIGPLVASYPLQLWQPRDQRLLATAEFLLAHCLVNGGFFQDMIHSGINAYLTLHLAQVLLRAGDPRFSKLIGAVAALASPTGQWPEAVHPHTGGGCMGDGQHVWAAAEWVLMLRNCFIREERTRLILASGILPQWLTPGEELRFGPTLTSHGEVTVIITPRPGGARVRWRGRWREKAPAIEVLLPGCRPVRPAAGEKTAEVRFS